MLSEINLTLRRRLPSVHRLLKDASRSWREGGNLVVPVPRRYGGKTMLVHPSFLTADFGSLDPVGPWIASNLKKGDTFFDVGANFGFFTWFGATLVGRNGRVVAFEPSAANLSVLKYHARVNYLKQATIEEQAVSSKSESNVPFYLLQDGLSASNSLTIDSPDAPRIAGFKRTVSSIETIAIDDFIARSNVIPNLIKIDVEGAEGLVCDGSGKTLSVHRPIVILAVHPFWLPPEHTPSKIYNSFARHGYTITDHAGQIVTSLGEGDYLCRP